MFESDKPNGFKRVLVSGLNQADYAASKFYMSLFSEGPSLTTLLFHGLLNDLAELEHNSAHPQQAVTVEKFSQLIEYLLENEFEITTPDKILKGLEPTKKHLLVTFDDGYYNNALALPVLEEFGVPAVFFVSSNHILENRSFWWDAVYRQGKKYGASDLEIATKIDKLKLVKSQDAEAALVAEYGRDVLQPICDIDRPFTPSEFSNFAKSPYAIIGNHTANHAILTNYGEEEVEIELRKCQEFIKESTGHTASMVSYPNGNVNKTIVDICKRIGFDLGIVVNERKNDLPISTDTDEVFLLNRFVYWGARDIEQEGVRFRSDFQLKNTMKSLFGAST